MKRAIGQTAERTVLDSTWCGVRSTKRAYSSSAGVGGWSVIQIGFSGSLRIAVQYC
jgi:hypothetical protein